MDSATIKWAEELDDCRHGDNADSYVLLDETRVNVNRQFKKIIDKSEDY